MRIVENRGADRVLDLLAQAIEREHTLEVATAHLSLFAFDALAAELLRLERARLVLPTIDLDALQLLGAEADRAARNRLQARWLAAKLARWLDRNVEVKTSRGAIPQATVILQHPDVPQLAITGNCELSTEGLGLTPAPELALVQATESDSEASALARRFLQIWNGLPVDPRPQAPPARRHRRPGHAPRSRAGLPAHPSLPVRRCR